MRRTAGVIDGADRGSWRHDYRTSRSNESLRLSIRNASYRYRGLVLAEIPAGGMGGGMWLVGCVCELWVAHIYRALYMHRYAMWKSPPPYSALMSSSFFTLSLSSSHTTCEAA